MEGAFISSASPQPTYEQNGKHRLFFQNFEMTSESRITCPLQLENLSSVRIHIVQLKIISPLLLKQLNFHFLGKWSFVALCKTIYNLGRYVNVLEKHNQPIEKLVECFHISSLTQTQR